jgi:hypothetical protein
MSVFAFEDDADFASYFVADYGGHGISASYTPYQSETSTTINIILDEEFLEADGESVNVETTIPIAYCRTIDVSSARHGDTLVVDATQDLDGNTIKAATTYKVIETMPDKTGITMLRLEEQ